HRTALRGALPNIAWRVTREHVGDPYPKYVQTAGPDMYNLANYSGFRYQRTDQQGFDDILALRADARKNFVTAFPLYVKAGVNYRGQNRDIDRKFWDYAYTGTQPLTRFLDRNWDYNLGLGPSNSYRSAPYPGIDESTAVFEANPGDFTQDIASSLSMQFLNNKRIKEEVGAAYAMGGVTFGKLSVVGGARLERTQDDGEGPKRELTRAESARRAAFVGPLTAAEIERRTIAEYGGRQETKTDYADLFPSMHAKFQILPGFLARASWATGIGRPSFADVIPSLTINEDARTISATNPGLKPQYAKNIDVSLEYYFEPVGVLSVGYFHKKITDFIFSDTQVVGTGAENGFGEEYAGFILSTTANGGYGIVKGYEINYSQQLSKLPGLLSRFGVYANYTKNNTEGNYDSGGGAVQSTNEIVGFIPETANIGVSYVQNRLDLRVQWNWRGKYLVAYSSNPASLRFEQPRGLVNLRTKVRVYKNYSFYFDVLNVFNEAGDDQYIFSPSRPFTRRHGSPRYYFGISGTY
ncbi:MAG: TonB-dependent receptor domain-containing protein, partial [Opitutaceae bacterium]